ncbi:ATPase, T2SS/T4P/T4SS family [Pseudomonas sp. JG-B]|uniref:ATPase, T2SS/T4P/T4SS family n=1 Tax=Pseudomonas sp. JG-B TaxID=2603214 RepID=UPI0035591077
MEYRISDPANQTPLKREAGQSDEEAWQASIKNAMRLDPDVLMLGEIRDSGSARMAIQGALTGHGLWSTLHTKDATSSLQRLLDLGVAPALVLDPGLIKGVVSQSLTRVLCPECKVPYSAHKQRLDEELQQRIESMCIADNVYLRGEDPQCPKCTGKGIVGRIVCAEVIIPNLKYMRIFRDKGKAEAHAYWVTHMGGITKTQAAIRHINKRPCRSALGGTRYWPAG